MGTVAHEAWPGLLEEFDREIQEEREAHQMCREIHTFARNRGATSCVVRGGAGRMNALIDYMRLNADDTREHILPNLRFLLAFQVNKRWWNAVRRGNSFISVCLARRIIKK